MRAAILGLAALLMSPAAASGQDFRERAAVPAETRAARAAFAAQVKTDPVTGAVASVGRTDDLLTGPSKASPESVALGYVRQHQDVFGLGKADVANLKLVARAVSPDGITHLRYNQVLDGIESYRVEAIRENGEVAVAGADRTFTTASAVGAPRDRSAPAISKAKVRLVRVGKRRRATFSFSLSEPARVTAAVTVAAKGIRRGSRCVAVPKRRPKRARSCTRQASAARASVVVTKAGAATLALPRRGLGKGRYTAVLTAVDAAGNRSRATVRFTIR